MLKQKTLKAPAILSGRSLQTGNESTMTCSPAEVDTGIVFKRRDITDSPLIRLSDAVFSSGQERRSSIAFEGSEIQTVEHFLASLWAMEIDNVIVEVEGPELPAMDGSAICFFEELKKNGVVEQEKERKVIKITSPEKVEYNNSSIAILPSEEFSVSYAIDYDISSIKKETFEITLNASSFEQEIAPARTFCMKAEAEALLKAGLGQGATYENTLVMDEDGPVGTTLRFPNEPVRHKVLDLVGDLYLLGIPVSGKVIAERSGHRLNLMLLKKIYENYVMKR